jgi:regulator of replication initiation timing
MTDTKNITDEKAARRFHQIAVLERQIQIKSNEIAQCKSHLKELNEESDGLMLRLRSAARNEGELPLFSMDDE